MKNNLKLTITLDVPYESYGSKSKDRKVESQMIQNIKETCRDELSFVSFDNHDGEDCSSEETKIKVKREK